MKTKIENEGLVGRNERFVNLCAAAAQKLVARLDSARESVLAQFRGTLEANDQMARLALKEADALAWQTGFPQLFFPTLATEKLQAVANWEAHQQAVLQSPRAV